MKGSTLRLVGACLMFVLVGGLVAACGDKEEADTRSRDGMPLMGAKLRNSTPVESPPASAQVQALKQGRRVETHEVPPVASGEEGQSQPPGTKPADGVSITVNAGQTLTGEGSYPGQNIEMVEIDVTPEGATATVKFYQGPAQTIPLQP